MINDKAEKPSSQTLIDALKKASQFNSTETLKTEDIQLQISNDSSTSSLLNKILSKSVPFSELCRYTLGMQVYHNTIHKKSDIENRIYHSDKKIDKTYFPESGGMNVLPYIFNPKTKEYVSYGDWCYNKPDWDFCSKERILIREIPSKTGLVCCISDTTHIPNKAVIIVIGKKNSNYLLLGILNSKLMGFYVFQSTEKGKQRLFPRVSLTTIKNLPFKKEMDSKITSEIEKGVKNIIALKNELTESKLPTKVEQIKQRIEHSEEKINQLVYELYELTDEEIKIVGGEK